MADSEAFLMLGRTPNVVGTLLADLPDDWSHRDDGPGSWSAHDIVGHLLHADATNWLPRIRTVLSHGTDRPFGRFDREAMLGWEPEDTRVLIDRFRTIRAAGLAELDALGFTTDDFARRGTHPDLGEISLTQLVGAWVAHDLTHLAQIGEVLARRYRDVVGPYRAFMPALDRVAPAE